MKRSCGIQWSCNWIHRWIFTKKCSPEQKVENPIALFSSDGPPLTHQHSRRSVRHVTIKQFWKYKNVNMSGNIVVSHLWSIDCWNNNRDRTQTVSLTGVMTRTIGLYFPSYSRIFAIMVFHRCILNLRNLVKKMTLNPLKYGFWQEIFK